MLGGIIMAVLLVVAIPVAIMMTGAVFAAVLGWSLRNEGVAANEGSELLACNR